MQKFKLAVCGILGLITLNSAITLPTFAVTCPAGSLRGSANSLAECNVAENADGSDAQHGLINALRPIINFIIGIGGLIAVVIIIIAGVTIATSQGDAAKVSKATRAIIFSIVGLLIAILAFAIVNFILDGIAGAGGASSATP